MGEEHGMSDRGSLGSSTACALLCKLGQCQQHPVGNYDTRSKLSAFNMMCTPGSSDFFF
eukprot:CAMPEP_0174370586 /NCGR_PEP_ID=MMETSP0811_2-20130205/96586_1 /TAXON_ID=73025 ORGANISM="Eutreptiella gymnastica-like, Strain CCMP1594" /NCGR_SAMPLE_ID=MMETSP0811_2 /ASSEMBLY_ACC=CAM_ASM_000667 /LENGTH=58 /DNA_ID=CAMNT_0015516121 /DNA_START=123 /DNA_END=296 /DNA_ORIENTATION=-